VTERSKENQLYVAIYEIPPQQLFILVETTIEMEKEEGCIMLNEGYSLCFAEMQDIDSWLKMIEIVRDNFPGLETTEKMDGYRQTVIKNIKRETALCVKYDNEIVGAMIFSYHSQCLSCMAVHPKHRRQGIASAMIGKMISLFPNDVDISVITFREGDIRGIAPRPLYKKFGFEEDELVIEFEYPEQKFILYRKGRRNN
jgi:ribosomal protein S18 acetylase RimI-like enzyme